MEVRAREKSRSGMAKQQIIAIGGNGERGRIGASRGTVGEQLCSVGLVKDDKRDAAQT